MQSSNLSTGSGGMDFSLQGFEKTLDAKTIKYLNAKTKTMDKVDLRQLSDDVVNELKTLQNEAAIDYLKVENETYELLDEIKKSDDILGELEDVLKSFRDGLSQVKTEMTFLQERSVNMNISLNNRKNLSKTFANFIDNVMLEPELIDDILEGPIDDTYIENIKKLCKKLAYIKKYKLLDNLCVREIEPELSKLKIKACERIKLFVMKEIEALKKPKTNIHLIQQNKLITFKIFIMFLRDHNRTIYFEVLDKYAQTMNKIYNDNLRLYINELNKLAKHVNTKNDIEIIFPENPDAYKVNRFDPGQRLSVVEDTNDQLIVAHAAQQKNQKFTPEFLYKSLNRMLVETAGHEYTFCQNFFSLSEKHTSTLFPGIMKQTVTNVLAKINNWIRYSYDPFTPLIIGIANNVAKDSFKKREFDILDFYFDQINIAAWPKFNELFEYQISSLKNVNLTVLKSIERSMPAEKFMSKALHFLQILYRCSDLAQDNQMLKYRITKLLEEILKIMEGLAEMDSKKSLKQKNIYLIIKYDQIISHLKKKKVGSRQDKYKLKQDLEKLVGELVEEILKEYYSNLVNFIAKGKTADTNKDSQNLTLLENISREFCDTWLTKLNKLREECDNKFESSRSKSDILRKVMRRILDIYTCFFNIVKGSYPSFTSNMVPLHKLTMDIKNQINSLEQ